MKIINITDPFLKETIVQAQLSVKKGGGPIGAVVVKDKKIISRGVSAGNIILKPYAHAEHTAIKNACSLLKSKLLPGCTLYSSFEPCMMCLGTIYWANIRNVVFGCTHTYVPQFNETTLGDDDFEKYFQEKVTITYNMKYLRESQKIIDFWLKKQK